MPEVLEAAVGNTRNATLVRAMQGGSRIDTAWFLIAAFGLLRICAVVHGPVHFPDTPSYVPFDLLGNEQRLWTVPLVYNVFPTDGLREAAQLALGIFAWSALGLALDGALEHRWTRRAGLVVVLLLGLVPQVTGWDSALLSESIATSLLVLLVALLVRLLQTETRSGLASCLLVVLLWEFVRQDNVLVLVAMTPFIVVAAFRWLSPPRAWASAGLLCAIVAWGTYDAVFAGGDRHIERNNTLLILEYRIAPDPSALRFFTARGLPLSQEILLERNAFKGGASPLYRDRRLLDWIDHRFRSAYATYLLRHPLHTLGEPLRQTPAAISSPVSSGLRARMVMPAPLQDILWSTSGGEIPFWFIVAAVALLMSYRIGARRRFWVFAVFLVLVAVFGAEFTWTLSGYPQGAELARQFMLVAISARLGLVIAVAFATDAYLRRRQGNAQDRLRH